MVRNVSRRFFMFLALGLVLALLVPAQARDSQLAQDAATNYLHAAAIHLQNDDLDRAVSILEEALDRAATTPELLTLLAQAYHRQGHLEKAANVADEALTHTPDYAPAHLELGDIYRDLGWLESACECYRGALGADQTAPAAKERLVRTLLESGKAPEAAHVCREFLAERPTASLQTALGDVMQAQGDLAGARQTYERALDSDDRCARAHCGLAEVLLKQGDTDRAAKEARAALATAPDLARAHACLSHACAQDEDYLGAYGHAVKAEKAGIDMSAVWSLLQTSQ